MNRGRDDEQEQCETRHEGQSGPGGICAVERFHDEFRRELLRRRTPAQPRASSCATASSSSFSAGPTKKKKWRLRRHARRVVLRSIIARRHFVFRSRVSGGAFAAGRLRRAAGEKKAVGTTHRCGSLGHPDAKSASLKHSKRTARFFLGPQREADAVVVLVRERGPQHEAILDGFL